VEISGLIRQAHRLLEARECRRIPAREMASRIGVSSRAYTEYERGTNEPLAMKALISLLSSLEDDEIIKIIRSWQNESKNKTHD